MVRRVLLNKSENPLYWVDNDDDYSDADTGDNLKLISLAETETDEWGRGGSFSHTWARIGLNDEFDELEDSR